MDKESSFIHIPREVFRHTYRQVLHGLAFTIVEKDEEVQKMTRVIPLLRQIRSLNFFAKPSKGKYETFRNLCEEIFYLTKNNRIKEFLKDFQYKGGLFSFFSNYKKEQASFDLLIARDIERQEPLLLRFQKLYEKTRTPLITTSSQNAILRFRVDFKLKTDAYHGIFQNNHVFVRFQKSKGNVLGEYQPQNQEMILYLPEDSSRLDFLYSWIAQKLKDTLRHELVHFIQSEVAKKIKDDSWGIPKKSPKENTTREEDLEFYALMSDLVYGLRVGLKDREERIHFVTNFDDFSKEEILHRKRHKKNSRLYWAMSNFILARKSLNPKRFRVFQKQLLEQVT